MKSQHIASEGDDCPFGPKYERYWLRRYDLFSRFDEGVEVDAEGLASVKPEAIALDIAGRLKGQTVLDAFCGLGGSAIGFARAGKKVISIDRDVSRVNKAVKNARIYGVEDRITFVVGDTFELFDVYPCQAVYFDPSWGGPDYKERQVLGFEHLVPDIRDLLHRTINEGRHTALTIPKNFDLRQFVDHERDFFLHWGELKNERLFMTVYL